MALRAQAHVDTDNRLDAAGEGLAIELDHRKQVGLIGQGHRRHFALGDRLHQCRDAHQAVHERVLGVDAQVNEGIAHRRLKGPSCRLMGQPGARSGRGGTQRRTGAKVYL